jgi:hypothetical protein
MSVMIDQDSVVVRTGDLVVAPMGDELAIMDMASGTYFVLDAVAAAIWERIETPREVRSLCRQLSRHYDVAEQRCVADVLAFLRRLQDKRLVRLADDRAG